MDDSGEDTSFLEEIPLMWDPNVFGNDSEIDFQDLIREKEKAINGSPEKPDQEVSSPPKKIIKRERVAVGEAAAEPLENIIAVDFNNGFKRLSQKYPMVSFRKVEQLQRKGPFRSAIKSVERGSPSRSKKPAVQVYRSSRDLLRSPEHRAMPKLESLAVAGVAETMTSPAASTTPRKSPPSPPHLSPQLSLRNGGSSSKRKSSSECPMDDTMMDLFTYYTSLPKSITVETYYCGELEGKSFSSTAFPENLHCTTCEKILESNVDVFPHMFNHGKSKLKAGSVWCPYCMQQIRSDELGEHVKMNHHMIDAGCCRICEKKFPEEYGLVIHMWANHCRYDMPYACGICDYRSSLKFQCVDHFNTIHRGSAAVLCPICLQVLACNSDMDMKEILAHTQLHQASEGHRCGHCALVFPQQSGLSVHFKAGYHTAKRRARNSRAVIPYRNEFGVKLSLMPRLPPQFCEESQSSSQESEARKLAEKRKKAAEAEKISLDQCEVHFNITNEICLECGVAIRSEGHYQGRLGCSKCDFRTCCLSAIRAHFQNPVCKAGQVYGELPATELWLSEGRLECKCGFKCVNPNRFACHLSTRCSAPSGRLVPS